MLFKDITEFRILKRLQYNHHKKIKNEPCKKRKHTDFNIGEGYSGVKEEYSRDPTIFESRQILHL